MRVGAEKNDGAPKTTPFAAIPAACLDEWMPRLRDTEFRVLLTICRQTVGRRERQADGQYVTRRRDWISHRQFVKRTGRGSEAVSTAIQSLVGAGLIVAETANGKPLATAAERRRYLGKAYYRLGELDSISGEKLGKTALASRLGKAGTTREGEMNKEKAHARQPLVRQTSGWWSASRLPYSESI